MQQEHYRPKYAAEYIGVGLSTLWRYAKIDPTFPKPAHISARLTLFKRADLDAWVESRRMGGGDGA